MNVFDFDNTLYNGESSVDILLFCIWKRKTLIITLPFVLYCLIAYKLRILKKETVMKFVAKFSKLIVKYESDFDAYISEFWSKNIKKLRSDMLELVTEDDAIITGAVNIVLDGIRDKLKTDNIICTQIDRKTGKLEFHCYMETKVTAFKEKFPDKTINKFYTDSYVDLPMMKISKEVFLVKKHTITKIDVEDL